MKIKSLLMLGALLMVSGAAMAQTTITSGNAKLISDNQVQLNYYYTNAEVMGGFQMVVSLPDGVTLEEDAQKTTKGLSINGGEAAPATFYNVVVPEGFECIGVKADVDGTTSDGTAYKAGDVLLVCFPVEAGAKYKATETPSRLCSLTLNATSENNLESVAIKGFAGSDTEGTGGAEAAAKYAVAAGSQVSPAKVLKLGDVNGDTDVDALDIQDVISALVAMEYIDDGDVNNDEEVDALDIQDIISIIVNE
jgi:hypothetical protein